MAGQWIGGRTPFHGKIARAIGLGENAGVAGERGAIPDTAADACGAAVELLGSTPRVDT